MSIRSGHFRSKVAGLPYATENMNLAAESANWGKPNLNPSLTLAGESPNLYGAADGWRTCIEPRRDPLQYCVTVQPALVFAGMGKDSALKLPTMAEEMTL